MARRSNPRLAARPRGSLRSLAPRLLRAGTRPLLGSVHGVVTREPVAALTFDDGPDPDTTPRFLDLLQAHGARATFFMRGVAAQAHPELVRRVAEAGHAIGNHTWDHPSMPHIGAGERRRQLRMCARALAPYGRTLFRPPYGHQNLASRLDASLLGYEVVAWSGHGFDFLDHGAERIHADLAARLRPGAILLLHDTLHPPIRPEYADRGPLLAALDALLRGAGRTFRFVTVPELLRSGRVRRKDWYRPGDVTWLNGLNGGDTRQYPPAPRGPGRTSTRFETDEGGMLGEEGADSGQEATAHGG